MNRWRNMIFIMVFLILGVLGGIYLLGAVTQQVDAETPKGIPILMYHKVNPNPLYGGLGLRVPPQKFDWQMAYLKKNGYHTVNLGDVLDHYEKGKRLPLKPIVITFDDGYRDNFEYAYPILQKYNYTATVFVVAGTIGKTNEFDVKGKLQPENPMMNWYEIRKLAAGGITIGSHTWHHPHLSQLTPAVAREEIVKSKEILEQGLGKKVQYFCYPYGDLNPTVTKIVEDCGFRGATTTKQGLATASSNPLLLERIRITGHYDQKRFIEELHKYDLTKTKR